MPFNQHRHEIFQDHIAIQFDQRCSFHAAGTGCTTASAAELFRAAPAKSSWPAAENRTEQGHRFRRRREILRARPETVAQVFKLLWKLGFLQLRRLQIEAIKRERLA